MPDKGTIYALIFAGGIGKRMHDADIPKQFLEVDGKPIIIRTLEHFSQNRDIDEIVVVCIESWIEKLNAMLDTYGIRKVSAVIPGGESGFQSIHKGILEIAGKAADDDIILICDGVRPQLTQELISRCVAETVSSGSAVPITPSIDSILYSEDGSESSRNFDRKKIYTTQAPQGYRFKLIRDAHIQAADSGIEAISSADLLINMGIGVHTFPGIRENIKVTTPEDLDFLRAYYYYEHFRNFAREEMNVHGDGQ